VGVKNIEAECFWIQLVYFKCHRNKTTL